MSRRRSALIAAVVGVMVAAAGCDAESAAEQGNDARLAVVTTVAPITSIVAQVGGNRVDVTGLVPEGTNSHTFEPPPSASEVLSRADVVIMNGLRLEEPTKALAERTMGDDATLVELGTEVLPESDYIYDFSFPKEDGKPNPHLWTDPTYATAYAEQVRDTLTELDPEGAESYRDNTAAFVASAETLADALRADQRSLPRERRLLLTYHDAYAYFAENFDWTVVGAIQPSSFAEPSPKEVAALIDQVRRRDVPAIFGSEVFPSRVLEQIGDATGVRYVDSLRDDDLPGEPGDAEHSWQGLMRLNYVTMLEALGGRAPELTAFELSDGADDAVYPQ